MAGRQVLHACDLWGVGGDVGGGEGDPPTSQYHTALVEGDTCRHRSSLHSSKSFRAGKGAIVFTVAPDLVSTISVGGWGFSYTNKAFVPSTHQLPESPDIH